MLVTSILHENEPCTIAKCCSGIAGGGRGFNQLKDGLSDSSYTVREVGVSEHHTDEPLLLQGSFPV